MPELTRFVWLVWIVVGFAFTYGNYLTTLSHEPHARSRCGVRSATKARKSSTCAEIRSCVTSRPAKPQGLIREYGERSIATFNGETVIRAVAAHPQADSAELSAGDIDARCITARAAVTP